MIRYLLLPAVLAGLLLNGCAHAPSAGANLQPPPSKTLSAIGYGTISREQQLRLTAAQRKLMAIRASKLDALRALAEQVYGIRLDGQTSIEDMAIKNDQYRAYIDSYLRGARISRSSPVEPDTYETVVELELTPVFYQCLTETNTCDYQAQFQAVAASAKPETVSAFSGASRAVAAPRSAGAFEPGCKRDECYDYPVTRGFDDYSISRY